VTAEELKEENEILCTSLDKTRLERDAYKKSSEGYASMLAISTALLLANGVALLIRELGR